MSFLRRLGYYLSGFSIGIVLLLFFLQGKKTSCNYMPNARVLKDIRSKERLFSEEVLQQLRVLPIDTSDVSAVLVTGQVDFSKSDTRTDSCKTYWIEGQSRGKRFSLRIKNCDSLATVQQLVTE